MAVTLVEQAGLAVRPDLRVETGDIEFRNAAPGEVLIEFTVRNHGAARSEPTTAHVQAAPLGAFVAWRPLDEIVVPSLGPGEEITLRLRAEDDTPPLLTEPQRVTSSVLLTALDLRDRRDPADRPDPDEVTTDIRTSLPADPLRLLGRGGLHWAGNLNIFIGGRATERHMAQALRVHPGRTNIVMFVVGQGADDYAFSLEGSAAAWNARLFESPYMVGRRGNDAPLEPGRWIRIHGTATLMLAMNPPADCRQGTVNVHVDQKSTGREAVVEFSLDPKAKGPGCYVVE